MAWSGPESLGNSLRVPGTPYRPQPSGAGLELLIVDLLLRSYLLDPRVLLTEMCGVAPHRV